MYTIMYIIIAFQGIEIEEKMKPHTGEKLSKTSFANVKVPTPRILPECTLKYPSKSIKGCYSTSQPCTNLCVLWLPPL